jgi:hypothetical protein
MKPDANTRAWVRYLAIWGAAALGLILLHVEWPYAAVVLLTAVASWPSPSSRGISAPWLARGSMRIRWVLLWAAVAIAVFLLARGLSRLGGQ